MQPKSSEFVVSNRITTFLPRTWAAGMWSCHPQQHSQTLAIGPVDLKSTSRMKSLAVANTEKVCSGNVRTLACSANPAQRTFTLPGFLTLTDCCRRGLRRVSLSSTRFRCLAVGRHGLSSIYQPHTCR